MNKVIIVNLGGNAWHLEEPGYDALRAYLENAGARLAANPDRDEILSDVERSIADKFQGLISPHKSVVTAAEVTAVLGQMGPVDDGSEAGEASGATATASAGGATSSSASAHASWGKGGNSGSGAAGAGASAPGGSGPQTYPDREYQEDRTPHRLFRVKEGAMIGGVCNGIGAYLGLDATIVRLVFIVAGALTAGLVALAYLVMILVIPVAKTSAEKAAAQGEPITTREFIRRAKAGYYEGMRDFPDRHSRREWKRKFKRDMREWKRSFRSEMKARAWHFGPPPGVCAPGGAGPTPGQYWDRTGPLMLFGLIGGLWTLLCLLALLSLVMTGAIFGWMLPVSIPLWMALIAILLLNRIVIWPLRVARHAHMAHWRGRWYGGPPIHSLTDSLFGFAVLGVVIWFADRHSPPVHHFIQQLPAQLHHAAEELRGWWSQR